MRRDLLKAVAAASLLAVSGIPIRARHRFTALNEDIVTLVAMKTSAFPYHGDDPESREPFMNVREAGRLGHKSPRGGVRWEQDTYSDKRTLLAMPAGFNLGRPAALVVFFHGNDCILDRDVVGRQRVPAQLAQSGINGVLAAPQLAVDARDSSPGNFCREGYFARWLSEVAAQLATLHGQGAKPADFASLPIVLVAYSGGYFPAAWVLKQGGAQNRIAGVVLLDALYGDTEKFADWARAHRRHAFLFSTFTTISRVYNLQLQDALEQRGIGFSRGYPATLRPGQIYFGDVPDGVNHVEFLSLAWTEDPLRWTLARIPGFRRG